LRCELFTTIDTNAGQLLTANECTGTIEHKTTKLAAFSIVKF